MNGSSDKPYLGIQFPREIYYELKEAAQERGMSLKKMARIWLVERLEQEHHRKVREEAATLGPH